MYSFLRFFLFLLPPERAHKTALSLMHFSLAIPAFGSLLRLIWRPKQRRISLLGCEFLNPVGLAAGFDKNGEHIEALSDLGFGFIEIGSVTAKPSLGNAQPRLFRLPVDEAIINRMGLNNEGVDSIVERLKGVKRDVPLFINVAKTHDSELVGQAAIDDYRESIEKVLPFADVLVINISCPNSGDGRTFEDPESLESLLSALHPILNRKEAPVLLKLSPDLNSGQLDVVLEIAERYGIDGFTATNTTVARSNLKTEETTLQEIGPGGLSGAPLHEKSLSTVRYLRQKTNLPIIGVGGIMGHREAQAFIDAGANLVQLYSGFVYRGPKVIKNINENIILTNPVRN